MQTTITTAMISPTLATAERQFWRVANTAQGIAAVGCILTDTALDVWQEWSDATFAAVQPHLESVLVNLAYLISYALKAAYGFCRQSLQRTWAMWLETAEQRAAMIAMLTPDYSTVRMVLYAAWGVIAITTVTAWDALQWVAPRAGRLTMKGLGAALCVNW